MLNRKIYLLIAGFGVFAMVFSQFMASSWFYGSDFGRAWAHVFWLGILLFLGSLLFWFLRYIVHHKNPAVVTAGKYEFRGVVGITGLVGLVALFAITTSNEALTGHDGDARRGILIIWLFIMVVFTIINLSVLLGRMSHDKK